MFPFAIDEHASGVATVTYDLAAFAKLSCEQVLLAFS
jgi:hypothetical protein